MGLGDDHPFIVLGLGFRVLGCVGWHLSRALSSLLLLLLCPLSPESLCSLMTDEDIVGLPPGAVLQITHISRLVNGRFLTFRAMASCY